MAKTKKIIHAGSLVIEAIYPRGSRHDSPKVRAAKQKASSAAQVRMNQIYSYQKLELMLAANFPRPGSGLVVTLTYNDNNLPFARKLANDRLKYFRAKLSAARKAKDQELVMFWATESRHGDGRYHHHCVINNTGEDYSLIRQLWEYGEDIEIVPLRVDKEKNYATLARYMAKEEREKVGLRAWSYTRNAKKPETETFTVPDDTQIQPPSGSTVLQDAYERTDYAAYRVVKYLAPGWERQPKPRAKRRRRRGAA